MGDAIAQLSYRLDVGEGERSGGGDRHFGWGAGEAPAEMRLPETGVLPDGEELFPEGEFEVGDDLAGRRLPRRDRFEIGLGIVVLPALRAGETASKAVRPRPIFAMHAGQGFGDAVARRHLSDLERDHEGGGQTQIPLVEFECDLANAARGLEMGCETWSGKDVWKFDEFEVVEGHVTAPVLRSYNFRDEAVRFNHLLTFPLENPYLRRWL